MISNLKISGFRRLREIDIPMRPLMVLIGANGVGKTSLLDAVTMLSSSAAGKLREKIYQLGGASNLLTRDKSEAIYAKVEKSVDGYNPLEYEIEIAPKNTSYLIKRENLSQLQAEHVDPLHHIRASISGGVRYFDPSTKSLITPDWEYDTQESALSQAPNMYKQTEEFRRILISTSHFRALDVSERAPVRLPQQMRPAESPGKDGENLVSFLYYLREQDGQRFETISDTLSAAFPDFEELRFPPVAAGMLAMTWKDRNFSSPRYMHELSEGTIRFLWLVSVLQSVESSAITMIDEPEVSLHPELLVLLSDLLREASRKTQLIVATHSDRLIGALKPEEVVTMDVDEDGCALARWADTMDIKKWLSEYSLDEVWRMGLMGGRSL